MRSVEPLVRPESEYYVHLPSTIASKVYLYPVVTGYFYYDPGYYLKRNSYDNYLLMYIEKGTCHLTYHGISHSVREGQVVLIDCRKPHEYGNTASSVLEISWVHFEGVLAKSFYDIITAASGNVMTPPNPYPITHNLKKLINLFASSAPLKEADMSRYITNMLSELISLHSNQSEDSSRSEIIESSLAYINEHFAEDLTLEKIAEHASLSPYYFTRVFTAETGFTPHQYVIATRINSAKYLLLSGELSVKEIAFQSGFNSESSFCSTFRKWEGVTPGIYRANIGTSHNRVGGGFE